MKRIILLGMSLLILLLAGMQSSTSKSATTAATPNRETVQRLYGSPVSEVYRTSDDLTVEATFAPTGSLCRARIAFDSRAGITDAQLRPVINELAPLDIRGKFKHGTFLDVICIELQKTGDSPTGSGSELVVDPCAECSGVSDDYERATITKYGNTNEYSSVVITYKRSECKGPKSRQPGHVSLGGMPLAS